MKISAVCEISAFERSLMKGSQASHAVGEKSHDAVVKFHTRIAIYSGIAQFSLLQHGFLVTSLILFVLFVFLFGISASRLRSLTFQQPLHHL